MIDGKEIREILRKGYLDTANVNLYLFENRKTSQNPFSVYELNINRDIVKEIRFRSKEYLSSILEESKSLHGIPDYNPDGGVQAMFKVASADVQTFGELYKYVSGQKACLVYNRKQVREDRLKAWIFRFEVQVGNDSEQILFFQHFQPGRMLGSKGITIFEQGNEFRLLRDHILHFNLDMDLLYYKDTLVITRTASAFESIFGYDDYYKEKARELVTTISGQRIRDYTVRFSDFDAVATRIETSSRLARKFTSARANGYFSKIHFDRLAALNKRRKLNLKLDDQRREWVIDDKLDLQVMAQILNDDYEFSQLTDNEYIALGKARLS